MNKLCIAFLILELGTAKANQKPRSQSVLSGTVNIIAANSAGIVVVTDSMLSASDGTQVGYPGEKLFQIDDQTVCSIAGYYSAPTDLVPELLNKVPEIIQRFRLQLSRQPAPIAVREKLRMLEAIFSHYVESVADVRADRSGNYRFQVRMAGYDPDDTPQVGSLEVNVTPSTDDSGPHLVFRSNLVEFNVWRVTNQLVLSFAGKFDVAENMLADAQAWNGVDEAIVDYARHCTGISGTRVTLTCVPSKVARPQLNVSQLKDLALLVKEYVSSNDRAVGGSNQIAVLISGKVRSVEKPDFPPVADKGFRFQIFSGDGFVLRNRQFMGKGIVIDPRSGPNLSLFFNDRFENVAQDLGDSYFSGNHFEGCLLQYESGIVRFDLSNVVHESTLRIGWRVQDSCEARQLANTFKWDGIEYEAGVPPDSKKPCRWISAADKIVSPN